MPGEKEFRKWIMTTAPKDWLLQTIETATGTGVPDLFFCCKGYSGWAELKSTNSQDCYMRISQWRWFNKLNSRGGYGLLMIKRLKDKVINVYDTSDLAKLSAATDCVLKGDDIVFPKNVKPAFSYKLGTGNSMFYKRWMEAMEQSYV